MCAWACRSHMWLFLCVYLVNLHRCTCVLAEDAQLARPGGAKSGQGGERFKDSAHEEMRAGHEERGVRAGEKEEAASGFSRSRTVVGKRFLAAPLVRVQRIMCVCIHRVLCFYGIRVVVAGMLQVLGGPRFYSVWYVGVC